MNFDHFWPARLIPCARTLSLQTLFLALFSLALSAQTETGELRLTVTDTAGLPVQGSAELVSQVNQYDRKFKLDATGHVNATRLPFGMYQVLVESHGLAPSSDLVEIRSATPTDLKVVLTVASTQTEVTVESNVTLIDPHRTGAVNRIGGDTLQSRLTAAPGRSLADLVNTEPGWLEEANGSLHPRGSEYQTQYVMDGIPLTDIRSSAYVADLDADDVQEISVMTGGYPAEYGRKLGGVVEVETTRDRKQGLHGKALASGGSFDSASGYLEGQYGWNANTLTLSAASSTTDRFLDPPVTQNYTNHGTSADFMGHYERDLGDSDRIGVIFRREQSKFLVPNEMVEQEAGQRQDRNSNETAVQFSYQHIFSPNVVGDFRAMGRDITASLWSNDLSTPIIAGQDRSYREGYVKAAVSVHHGINEIKVGAEGDFASINEALHYAITDPSQFDPGTPPLFNYRGRAQDREPAVFAQDLIRLKNWTFSGGLRYDHYSLLVQEGAWSPRLGIAYYWPAADIVFRASYDRVFQTPAFENLLVASSPEVKSLSDKVLRLPVEPSHGNFYEAGFSKSILGKLRIDGSYFHRNFDNYADDDLLLNTGVSFPIAFSRAVIYGTEVKVEVPHWGPFSGYISYSNSRGNGFFPVTGGLFLGDDAAQAVSANTGVFPVSQDQRNTVRTRIRYDINPRLWAAVGGSYNSGLPVEFNGTYEDAAAQYGQDILNRVNFSDSRARPAFSFNASVGAILSKREKETLRLQADAENITNQLNVINFAGLFSGTALAAPRSAYLRLQVDF
jgi:outer membrane cobalamin receptor